MPSSQPLPPCRCSLDAASGEGPHHRIDAPHSVDVAESLATADDAHMAGEVPAVDVHRTDAGGGENVAADSPASNTTASGNGRTSEPASGNGRISEPLGDCTVASAGDSTRARRTLILKLLVSAWVVYHVCGITIAPLSVPPSSDLVRNSWRLFGGYLQTLYLNHGFHFFAPDPGPSTVVRYTVVRSDGSESSGQIPDKSEMRPRLIYHRHFMLTEFLAATDNLNPAVEKLLVRALARQIAREHGASRITLTRVTHLLPAMEWCRSGLSLEDPQLYEEQLIGTFSWADL